MIPRRGTRPRRSRCGPRTLVAEITRRRYTNRRARSAVERLERARSRLRGKSPSHEPVEMGDGELDPAVAGCVDQTLVDQPISEYCHLRGRLAGGCGNILRRVQRGSRPGRAVHQACRRFRNTCKTQGRLVEGRTTEGGRAGPRCCRAWLVVRSNSPPGSRSPARAHGQRAEIVPTTMAHGAIGMRRNHSMNAPLPIRRRTRRDSQEPALRAVPAAPRPLRRSMGGASEYLQQVEGGSPRVDITPLDVTQPR